MQPTTAAALTNMMVDVVNEGTGTAASLADQGIQVAGKTGTAQTGVDGENAPRVVHRLRARPTRRGTRWR